MNFTRRRFLTGSLAGIAGATGPFPVLPTVHAASRRRRLKIAAVTTIYFKYSHAQHIVDRFLEGYGWNGRHHRPPIPDVGAVVVGVRAVEVLPPSAASRTANCAVALNDQLAAGEFPKIREERPRRVPVPMSPTTQIFVKGDMSNICGDIGAEGLEGRATERATLPGAGRKLLTEAAVLVPRRAGLRPRGRRMTIHRDVILKLCSMTS